jgi:hypothetical protein
VVDREKVECVVYFLVKKKGTRTKGLWVRMTNSFYMSGCVIQTFSLMCDSPQRLSQMNSKKNLSRSWVGTLNQKIKIKRFEKIYTGIDVGD